MPSVAPGYIIVWPPPTSCGRRNCTEFNPSTGQGDTPISSTRWTCFLIDGLVEGQYVILMGKKLQFRSSEKCGVTTSLPLILSPPWQSVIVIVGVPCMGQIKQFNNLQGIINSYNCVRIICIRRELISHYVYPPKKSLRNNIMNGKWKGFPNVYS